MDNLGELQKRLREFANERDWEQFHSPKNLSMALIVEAAELVEHFQWLTPEQSHNLPEKIRREVELEMADVFIYLLRLADLMGVDLAEASNRKIAINAEKYPSPTVRGRADKNNSRARKLHSD
jgi:NTP pyrophosphatase (non-canonical NTP hydrolase)